MKNKNLLVLAILILCSMITFNCNAEKNRKVASVNVASYNLRMDTKSDSLNAWPYRKESMKDLIRFYDFDIFGTQEGFKHMLDNLKEMSDYDYVGVGRDDGKDAGEHSAIFYKKSKLQLLDSGNFWYSETPDVPGLGWDATCCNRICSWGKFRDIKSGKVFFMFNSHYDHEGKVARRESSKLLLKKIRTIADKNVPVFVTGDFNASPDEEPMKIIEQDGMLKDSYKVSRQKPYGTYGTFNAFKPAAETNPRIDYIWVTDNIIVNKYGTLNDMKNGRYPSDHFPIMIKAKF